jgi:hypothetical protein
MIKKKGIFRWLMWGIGFGFLYSTAFLLWSLEFFEGWISFHRGVSLRLWVGSILSLLFIYPLQLLEKVLPEINSFVMWYIYAFICGFIIGTGIFFIKNKISSRKPLSEKIKRKFTVKKKIITTVTVVVISVFIGMSIKLIFIVEECGNRVTCLGNLEAMGLALRGFAQENGGRFPDNLSELYPKYTSSLESFICPSHQLRVTETDIAQNFEICYQYVPGLTTEHDANCLVVIEKKENHLTKPFFLNCTKPVRGVLFVSGYYRLLPAEEWLEVYRKHQNLIKDLSFIKE